MRLFALLVLILVVGCSYCSEDSDCTKCDGECLSDPVINCADIYGTFKCECQDGECEKVEAADCETDSDCMTSGCSGMICQSINSEPMFTTCEWLPEYGCYEIIDCSCNNGKCGWVKNSSFDQCIEDAKNAGGEVY